MSGRRRGSNACPGPGVERTSERGQGRSRETKRRQERAAAGGVGVQNTQDRSLATRQGNDLWMKRERGGGGGGRAGGPEPEIA